MEKVTDEMMDRLSVLAALELDDSQRDIIKRDLKSMIEYIDVIKVSDVDDNLVGNNNEDKEGNFDIGVNVLRKDEEYIIPMHESSKIIESAPRKEGVYVVVPKTT